MMKASRPPNVRKRCPARKMPQPLKSPELGPEFSNAFYVTREGEGGSLTVRRALVQRGTRPPPGGVPAGVLPGRYNETTEHLYNLPVSMIVRIGWETET